MAGKIKPGKFQKTRTGEKAWVAAAVPAAVAQAGEAWLGMIGARKVIWLVDGRVTAGVDSPDDLVDNWPKEVEVSGWMNIYDDGFAQFFPTKQEAKDHPRADVHALIKFEWKGGRNDD